MAGGTDSPAGASIDPEQADFMAARYGRRPTGRRRLPIALVAIGAAAALGGLVWTAWVHANPAVTGDLQSFDVVSEHQVVVTIEIRRRTGAAVTCTVEASASDHGLVGDQLVTVPAGSSGTVTYRAKIATDREATSATVSDCR